MKPLILILLTAVFAQAQTIADTARRERERQAQVKTTKVFTTEDLKSKDSAETPEAKTPENATPDAEAAAGAPAPPAAPVVDPVEQWMEQTAKLRAEVRDLMDQETVTQLEMNAASGQINAPITSQSAKDQAQRVLQESQQKLIGIRVALEQAQSQLRELDLQGPPQRQN